MDSGLNPARCNYATDTFVRPARARGVRILSLLAVPSALLLAAPAAAQQPGADDSAPAGEPTATEPAPPPAPPAPAPAPAPAARPAAPALPPPAAVQPPGQIAPPPQASEQPVTSRLLAPLFAEDRYPGDGLESSTEVDLVRPDRFPQLKFAMHGYFRAPMRVSRVKRTAGMAERAGGEYSWRIPQLVDDDYYTSGFLYLPVNQKPWNETYLSVGNARMTATVGLLGMAFSDAEEFRLENQLGLAQGWLTYRFNPVDNLHVRLKAGVFWDRFGFLPRYDTYMFGRTHQAGGQARVEYRAGDLTFWLLDGIGTHDREAGKQQGMTMIHYAHAGASWNRTVEVGAYYLNANTKDTHPIGNDVVDSGMTVYGLDARVRTLLGRGYLAYSIVDADQVRWLSPAIEVMHSYGRFLMDNYLGTDAGSRNGIGKLRNLAFEYDFSVADLARGLTGTQASPLPWGGDVTASAFGVLTKVESAQVTDWTDAQSVRATRRDGVTKWKYGGELGWRATEWAGVFLRYDRVVPDLDDSATSFRVISPRVALFTHFLSHEQIFFQFSSYTYKDAVQRREGQAEEIRPDEKVFRLQAQITY
jgi:hypothetical protein